MAKPIPDAHVGDMPKIVKIITDGKTAQDVSAAKVSLLELNLISPSGVVKTKTLGYETDGTDGKASVTLAAGDWDVSGVWQEQVQVTFVAGSQDFACTAEQRRVKDRLF